MTILPIQQIILSMMFVFLIIGICTGHTLCFVLGGLSICAGYYGWGAPSLSVVMTKIYDSANNYTLVAIPMFVLMANFLTYSKVADGLFESVRYLFGPFKGGLGIAVILVSTIFAATTCIVGASVVTMGLLATPILLKHKYDPALTCGLICGGGSLGILIPPSIMLVTMASYAQLSVGKLFLAAILPGLCLSVGYIIWTIVATRLHPDWGPAMTPEELAEMPFKKRVMGSLINMIPPVILIVGVLGTIFSGTATPTEASGVGALVALIMAAFYKQLNWNMLWNSLIDTMKTTSMVFILLFGANAFTGIFLGLGGDDFVMHIVKSVGMTKWVAYVFLCVLVFILGCFLDWSGIVMICFPIFLPIMDMFKFDRLWLVSSMAVLLQTCFMTPPFGFALFYIKGILPKSSGITMGMVYKGVVPFILIICVVVALCVFCPHILMYLPTHYG
jgi:tripartite ATP-independent transporter DctM subunit